MTRRTTGPIFGLMSLRTINLSDQWPFGLLTIRTHEMIFGPMTLRTTDLSDYWSFGPVHDFRTNEPSDQRPFGISSCPPLAYMWPLNHFITFQLNCESYKQIELLSLHLVFVTGKLSKISKHKTWLIFQVCADLMISNLFRIEWYIRLFVTARHIFLVSKTFMQFKRKHVGVFVYLCTRRRNNNGNTRNGNGLS